MVLGLYGPFFMDEGFLLFGGMEGGSSQAKNSKT